MKPLTDTEKAAICYHIFAGCNDRAVLFLIAEGEERYKKLKPNSLKTTCNNWFNSHRIQEGMKEFKLIQEDRENRKLEEIRRKEEPSEETEPSKREAKTTQAEAVNFLDPDEFLKFANLKANEIQDEKERRSYLEMIAKLMNYKDKDEEQQEQIKAYLPMICEKCELYKRCSACSLSSCPVSLQ